MFHLVWACLCYWAASPIWLMGSSQPPITAGYATILPFAILAVAFAQWTWGGGEFPAALRYTPLALLFTVLLANQGDPYLLWAVVLAILQGLGHLVGMSLSFAGLLHRPSF